MAACSAIGLPPLLLSSAGVALASGVTGSRATTIPDGTVREEISVRAIAVTGNSRAPSRTSEHAE